MNLANMGSTRKSREALTKIVTEKRIIREVLPGVPFCEAPFFPISSLPCAGSSAAM
ncbi:MAG: hypothetical protein LC781_20670 [Actinobacteria bacterium]|nr:hypothetical protein [Actinomycetota bacterium]